MTPRLFRTRITELFGIDHPILCGGLMWLSDARYVAASVNAGGMGFITPRSFSDPDAFRDELRTCRRLTGGKPFGVNLYLSQRPEENAIFDTHLDIALEEGVRHFESSGLPPTTLLPRLREAGAIVLHKVSAVRHAISAERAGVDAVGVVGMECGGHPGIYLVGTIVQALRAAQQVRSPLAVGGGIGHGAQMAAALALGADAVILGTRMTVAEEIWAHAAYKARVAEAGETDTRLVLARLKKTYRALDNEAARAVIDLEDQGVTDFSAYAPLTAGTNARDAYTTGDWNRGILSLGQAAVFADRIEPVDAIFDRLLAEAVDARDRLAGLAFDVAAAS